MSFNPYTCNPFIAYDALSESSELASFLAVSISKPSQSEVDAFFGQLPVTKTLMYPAFYHTYFPKKI